MALVLFCTMVRVRGRVGTAVLFLSRKVQPDCRSECVAVAKVARLNSVAIEKKTNSLKLSGDRLHVVTCPAAAAVALREELALLREEQALKS